MGSLILCIFCSIQSGINNLTNLLSDFEKLSTTGLTGTLRILPRPSWSSNTIDESDGRNCQSLATGTESNVALEYVIDNDKGTATRWTDDGKGNLTHRNSI